MEWSLFLMWSWCCLSPGYRQETLRSYATLALYCRRVRTAYSWGTESGIIIICALRFWFCEVEFSGLYTTGIRPNQWGTITSCYGPYPAIRRLFDFPVTLQGLGSLFHLERAFDRRIPTQSFILGVMQLHVWFPGLRSSRPLHSGVCSWHSFLSSHTILPRDVYHSSLTWSRHLHLADYWSFLRGSIGDRKPNMSELMTKIRNSGEKMRSF